MRHLLKKKLTVIQVLLFIILPIGVGFGIFKFVTKEVPKIKQKRAARRHFVRHHAKDTSAMGVLMSYVDSINNAEQLFGGSWSFYLADVNTGKALCKVDIDHGLAPASVMKVVTTGTALAILGPDYKFSTLLQYDGKIDKDTRVLNGNIYIKGGGDPSLGSETFGSSISKVLGIWVDSIVHMGIDSIAGSIIADEQAFEINPAPEFWTWEDLECDYGTGPGGLNIHENVYNINVSVIGKETRLHIDPIIPGLKLYNEVVFNPNIPKSYVFVEGAPFQYERTAMGEVSGPHVERSPMPDPALYCAQMLQSALNDSGIGLRDSATTMRILHLNNVKTEKKSVRKRIATILSPTLSELVRHTNLVSQNFYAENILRAVSLNEDGHGTSAKSINIIYNFWKQHGVDLRGICMVDGCGLARMNTITTHQLVDMLRVYAKDSNVFPEFYKSLPVAGETGTIRKLASGTEADDNLHAKSGTMARVKSYAGYVKTRSGEMLCFAMIGNNTLWSEAELKDKFARLFVLMARLP